MAFPHLDLLELDAARTGGLDAAQRAHLQQCPACAARLQKLRGLADRMRPPVVAVPPSIDRAILATPRRRRWGAAAIAAAVLLGVLWLPEGSGVPGDVDRSGRVDIVDAYALAVRLRDGRTPDSSWDVNGDGRVDQADVEHIATLSVDLGESR